MMKDVIVELLIMAFFLLIGCLLFNGRGGCFIPIYNALSEKEQNSYKCKMKCLGEDCAVNFNLRYAEGERISRSGTHADHKSRSL